jgi:hypothetical protein
LTPIWSSDETGSNSSPKLGAPDDVQRSQEGLIDHVAWLAALLCTIPCAHVHLDRIKINRAKKHLAELTEAINAFESKKPWSYDVVTEPHGSEVCEVYRYRQSGDIPIEWGAMVGDCVHNLRSAFDLLAHDLVRKGGGVPDDHTAFPVSKKEISAHGPGSTIPHDLSRATLASPRCRTEWRMRVPAVPSLRDWLDSSSTKLSAHRSMILAMHSN